MDFEYTKEDKALRDNVASLFDEPALTDLARMETAELANLDDLTRGFFQQLGETAYLAAEGMALLAAQEEVALRSGSLFLAVEASARLFGGLVEAHGGEALREDVLAPIQTGRGIGAVAATDAPEGEATSGVVDGDALVVTGTKPFVTNGPIADWLAVVALVGEEARPAVALVPRDAAGLTVGQRLQTVGYKGLAVSALTLDGVRVPMSHVLGPFDDATALEAARDADDRALTIASVGLIKRTYEASRQHAKSHKRGGKPSIRYQEVGFPLAEMVVWIQTAEWMLRRAVWMTSVGDDEAGTLLRCAKVFAGDAAQAVTSAGMSVVAGPAFLAGHPVARAYADAKYAAIAGTSSEKARMSIADDLIRRNPA